MHLAHCQVDCNRCGCRNGQIRCTRRQCAASQIRDRCQECLSEPLDQVCGINGVTYDSPCVAIYCAGLAPFDFFRGACADVVGKRMSTVHTFPILAMITDVIIT